MERKEYKVANEKNEILAIVHDISEKEAISRVHGGVQIHVEELPLDNAADDPQDEPDHEAHLGRD
jgi:hypothetical protein